MKNLISFIFFLIIIINITIEENPISEYDLMSDKEFIKIMNSGEKVIATSEVGKKNAFFSPKSYENYTPYK